MKNVIGDKRFEQLLRLSQTSISTQLLYFNFDSGLPYIAISLYCNDENEKQVLQTVLTNLVKKYLNIYGYHDCVLVKWKNRYDLNMPYLEIRYARNSEERRILDINLQNDRKNIIDSNTDLIDDTDNEDLNE